MKPTAEMEADELREELDALRGLLAGFDSLGLLHKCALCPAVHVHDVTRDIPRRGNGPIHVRLGPAAMARLLEDQAAAGTRIYGVAVDAAFAGPKVMVQGQSAADATPRYHAFLCEACVTRAEEAAIAAHATALSSRGLV